MPSSIYYPQAYQCQMCQTTQKHYVWSNEIASTSHTCIKCGAAFGYECVLDESVHAPIVSIPMTKDQIKKDRTKRSRADFQKNVLPTLTKQDQQHHIRKLGYKS